MEDLKPFQPRVGPRTPALVALLISLWVLPQTTLASPDHAGVRLGGTVNSGNQDIAFGELFARRGLPWTWQRERRWQIRSQLEAGLAMLTGGSDTAFALSIGPVAIFQHLGSRWQYELGIKPTWLSEERLGNKDMGSRFHFTSHIGILYRIRPHLALGYRLQHLSNAGVSNRNPGLNAHLLVLDWTPD